jgi:hypothetical protein
MNRPHLDGSAPRLVYDICRKVTATGEPLVELLAQMPRSPSISPARSSTRCVLAGRLSRPAGEMVDKALARASRPGW